MEGSTKPEIGPSGLGKIVWAEEGKKTGRPLSNQPSLIRPDGGQSPKRAEIYSKDAGTFRKMAEDREEDSEDKTDDVRQTGEGTSSAHRQTGRQKEIVLVWRSGCRTSCRQSRRFKAPILPVISEK
ncbi:hypothetical protein INR49_027731 [Caranx melampygus]|nr:hypothetical protein INR49_027731 [Caranx melampygus]